ncbi:MAG: hypothetical protein KDE27_01580 [Planctomycetes bacterium]|nr:hypothetical protein [Planctomycetota bacterium]
MKTCKSLKILAAFGLSAAALAVVFPSYVGTLAGHVGEAMARQVPVTFELDRAELLIRGVAPQVLACKRQVAEAEVALAQLDREVEALGEKVEVGRRNLELARQWLGSSAGGTLALHASLAAVPAAANEHAVHGLQRRLEELRRQSALLDSKRLLQERQRRTLALARERLQGVRSEQERLADRIAHLRLQQQQIEAMAAQAPTETIDTSALSEAKVALADIQQRLDVTQKVLENDLDLTPVLAVPPLAVEALMADVEEFLAQGSAAGR